MSRFTTEVPVRYSDVDTYGHVNNATYATYLEEARIDYLEALLGDEDLTSSVDSGVDATTDGENAGNETGAADANDAVGMVVANLEIDFQRPIEPIDAVTVAVGVAELGRSSFTLEYEIRTDAGVHATAETTMVAFDRAARESRPLPDRWRSAVEEFEGISAD